ncbi:MobA/MobL family protein [Fusobacterium ulcerans]|uniref:MobA/MobL family protein n=1 Tax=Fusobacterium ulcerans TaxID=861 RepID=UPI001D0A0CC9|nr:MobA/MobL family protein [Fusobacterium ulcerans]MCB8564497.1 MobA/MobL family protein [Fusobacterium ulcerans]MCB8648668.1 MobA/MobL family protein [Fusobacterium ulcerans]
MAIYRFQIKDSTKNNTSAIDHFDYVRREGKFAPDHHDYISREGSFSNNEKYEDLVYKEDCNMPLFAKEDPMIFWKSSEAFERDNGRTYTEFEISLPYEFTDTENIKVAKEFLNETFGKEFVYSFALHRKESSKDGIDNVHIHCMFCERKLDGIERDPKTFFKRANPKDVRVGGCKKDRKWNAKNMPTVYRKKWEIFLNKELEKQGIEKVSCETLKTQRDEALRKGDKFKADLLDREPVNINGMILIKLEKSGIESLKEWEKEELENFERLKEVKKIKEEIYSYKLEMIKEEAFDLSDEKDKAEFNIENYIDQEALINYYEKNIDKYTENISSDKLREIALEQMTKGEHSKHLKEQEKYEKLKKERELTKEEEQLYLDSARYIAKYKYDDKILRKVITIEEKVKEKYLGMIAQEREKIDEIEKNSISIEAIKIKDNTLILDTFEKVKDEARKNISHLRTKQEEIKEIKKNLNEVYNEKGKDFAYNLISKGEYLKDKRLFEKSKNKLNALQELRDKAGLFDFNAKKSIDKDIANEKLKNFEIKERLSKIEAKDITKELKKVEGSFKNAVRNINKQEREISKAVAFNYEKISIASKIDIELFSTQEKIAVDLLKGEKTEIEEFSKRVEKVFFQEAGKNILEVQEKDIKDKAFDKAIEEFNKNIANNTQGTTSDIEEKILEKNLRNIKENRFKNDSYKYELEQLKNLNDNEKEAVYMILNKKIKEHQTKNYEKLRIYKEIMENSKEPEQIKEIKIQMKLTSDNIKLYKEIGLLVDKYLITDKIELLKEKARTKNKSISNPTNSVRKRREDHVRGMKDIELNKKKRDKEDIEGTLQSLLKTKEDEYER